MAPVKYENRVTPRTCYAECHQACMGKPEILIPLAASTFLAKDQPAPRTGRAVIQVFLEVMWLHALPERTIANMLVIFPAADTGVMSPYPTVVTVDNDQYSALIYFSKSDCLSKSSRVWSQLRHVSGSSAEYPSWSCMPSESSSRSFSMLIN